MEPEEQTDERIGKILGGRYQIVERIASGATGVVYRGELTSLKRKVAIKFLHALYNENKQILGRFEREAKAMSKLSHPFCVSVIDFGIDDSPYIVMDFVEGETLCDALEHGRFEPERAIRIVLNILAAVGHAHSEGIIHRDIKPANIQISQDQGLGETIRIFDFGLAKLLEQDPDCNLSEPERIMGTPTYMSPEQAVADKIDHRTDFYSIGIILFEMLTGRPPFVADDHVEIIRLRLGTKAPSLAEVCSEFPFSPELEAVVARALAKEPAQRFSSALEFSDALLEVPEAVSIVTSANAESSKVQPYPEEPSNEGPSERQALSEHSPAAYSPAAESLGTLSTFSKSIALRIKARKSLLITIVAVFIIAFLLGFFKLGSLLALYGNDAAPNEIPVSDRNTNELLEPLSPRELQALEKKAQDAAASGNIDTAIDSFTALRRHNPNNPRYIFSLANLFHQKKWWRDSLDHYEETLRIDESYASNQTLIRHVISMLGPPRLRKRAQKLILQRIGQEAIPALKVATTTHNSPVVRQYARKLALALDERLKKEPTESEQTD